MATIKNKISAVLPDADKVSILGFIVQISMLLPFLISLTEKERKSFRKMGPKSVDYVNLNLQGAQTFPTLFPANFNTAEFLKDVTLINQLIAIRVPLASLLEGIDDTLLTACSDAMQEGDTAYGFLKTGAANNAAVKALLQEIAQRFAGQGKKKTPPAPPKPNN